MPRLSGQARRMHRECLRKRPYSSESFARKVAAACERKRGVKLRAYCCGTCGRWHLTHEPEPQAVAAEGRS